MYFLGLYPGSGGVVHSRWVEDRDGVLVINYHSYLSAVVKNEKSLDTFILP